MRARWTRNGAAALMFVLFGVLVLVLAVATGSVLLAAIAAIAFVAAAASMRGFPIDRDW